MEREGEFLHGIAPVYKEDIRDEGNEDGEEVAGARGAEGASDTV